MSNKEYDLRLRLNKFIAVNIHGYNCKIGDNELVRVWIGAWGIWEWADYITDPKLNRILELSLLYHEWSTSYSKEANIYNWNNNKPFEDKKFSCIGHPSFNVCTAMAWCEMKGINYD